MGRVRVSDNDAYNISRAMRPYCETCKAERPPTCLLPLMRGGNWVCEARKRKEVG